MMMMMMHNNRYWFTYFVAVNYTACTHSPPDIFEIFQKYFTKYFMKYFTRKKFMHEILHHYPYLESVFYAHVRIRKLWMQATCWWCMALWNDAYNGNHCDGAPASLPLPPVDCRMLPVLAMDGSACGTCDNGRDDAMHLNATWSFVTHAHSIASA